jgi:hypothetical protein
MHDGIENLDEGKVQPPPPRKRRRHWWIYIVGPLAGGLLLALSCQTYMYVRRRVFQEDIVRAFNHRAHTQAEWMSHTGKGKTVNRIPTLHTDNLRANNIDTL